MIDYKRAIVIPAWELAIFPPEGDGGGTGGEGGGGGGGSATATASGTDGNGSNGTNGSNGSSNGNGSGNGSSNNGTNGDGGNRNRDGRGRFVVPTTEDIGVLRETLTGAADRINGAETRIGELNAENERNRTRNRELTTTVTTLTSRLTANDNRIIRAEAREALRTNGVIAESPEELSDIVDAFVRSSNGAIKINDATGEPEGITAHIATFKASRAKFFKPADGNGNGEGGGDGGNGGNGGGSNGGTNGNGNGTNGNGQRRNSTANGASTNGNGGQSDTGGNAGGQNAGLPDLRAITDPKARKEAYNAWKRGLRNNQSGGNGR